MRRIIHELIEFVLGHGAIPDQQLRTGSQPVSGRWRHHSRQPDLYTFFIFTAGEDFPVSTGSMHRPADVLVVIPSRPPSQAARAPVVLAHISPLTGPCACSAPGRPPN